MGGRPRIIPDGTYVLDDKDLEEYEELTIDAVMEEALDSGDASAEASEEESSGTRDADTEAPAPGD